MGIIAEILRWRDDRHQLAQLRFDLEDAENEYRNKVREQKLRRGTEAWDSAYFEYDTHREVVYAQIDEIETRNAIRRAKAWRVPIPQRPISEEPVYDDQHWSWSNPHGRYYLLTRENYFFAAKRMSRWRCFISPGLAGRP
jgi:hypothetical protein